MLRAAVTGCGDVSVVHLQALAQLPGVELVGVCDSDAARLAAATEAWDVPGFADLDALVEGLRPDVVHICTPHSEHAAMAAACLERGISVLLEKPLARTLAEGDQLVAVAERCSAKVGVCFQNRYNAPVAAMHRLLSSGQLGAVQGAAASVLWHRDADYYASRSWRGTWAGGGGGVLMNQAIHTVDLLQWLLGEVSSVHGHAATRSLGGVIEVEDTAEFVLEHPGGVRSVCYATLAHAVNAPVTLDVVTELATLRLCGDLTVTHADGHVDTVAERQGSSEGRAYWGMSHQLLIADFYARLSEDEPFWISPREARKSLRIVKGVYADTWSQQRDTVG